MNKDYQSNTLGDHLVAFLFSARSHSIRKRILWEKIQERRKLSRGTYDQALSRLKNGGFVTFKKQHYLLTEKGVEKYKDPYRLITGKLSKKDKILVIFDIPEKRRRARLWLRSQLKFWDFKMIQKSVWAGSGPLSKEFNEITKTLGIEKCIKSFTIVKK